MNTNLSSPDLISICLFEVFKVDIVSTLEKDTVKDRTNEQPVVVANILQELFLMIIQLRIREARGHIFNGKKHGEANTSNDELNSWETTDTDEKSSRDRVFLPINKW